MTYEEFRYLFIISASLSGLMFIISIFLFIRFSIPKVWGDVTGQNVKKAISYIREQNEQPDPQLYNSNSSNAYRSKITDKISVSGNLINHPAKDITHIETTRIHVQAAAAETTILENIETKNETMALFPLQNHVEPIFYIEQDITFIHTEEVIN